MNSLVGITDLDLLERVSKLAQVERESTVSVIEHLAEVQRRRLFLREACSSLYVYCRERLGYSEDEAHKRSRVARLALAVPAALDELRAGRVHLTGLYLLAPHMSEENATELLVEARGKSRRAIERMLAARFPKSTQEHRGRIEPISESRARVEFTGSIALCDKVTRALELCSHSVPSGQLGDLFERALDALIDRETKRREGVAPKEREHRDGAGRIEIPHGDRAQRMRSFGFRKRRVLKPGSRHIPVDVARAVRARDGDQCSFVDSRGRRCCERRFLTFDHHAPYAAGGAPTEENLRLLCSAHNSFVAEEMFGREYIERRRAERDAERDVRRKAIARLCALGFERNEVLRVIDDFDARPSTRDLAELLRHGLERLELQRWDAA